MPQQSLFTGNIQTVNVHHAPQRQEPDQSKDDIWKFRLEPRWAARLQQLIDAKKIDRSRFIRDCIELGEAFHGYKNLLLDNSDLIIELCKRIAKKN